MKKLLLGLSIYFCFSVFSSLSAGEMICVYSGQMNGVCYYSCPNGQQATAYPKYDWQSGQNYCAPQAKVWSW
ncbi:MAG TPA: hypothetical protein PL195_03895 [bacterium]|nr:hypothetical protein [bacterium]HQJ59680.1 hypothetical protein [bacterium]